MYVPKHFAESDIPVLHEFIRRNPFAILVTTTDDGLTADHLPVYLNTDDNNRICLQGHIATANPLWKNTSSHQQSLLIFQGSHSYITPSWLPSKKVNGKVVPTWNYSAVHVKGNIEFKHDAKWKMDLLDRLTHAQEGKLEQPWSVSDAPTDFIQKLLPSIVGFEIVINEIFGKFKLSQNQSHENRVGIVQGLSEKGHEMATRIPIGNV